MRMISRIAGHFVFLVLVLPVFAREPELHFDEDRKVKEISNLRHVESSTDYLVRKVEALEQQVAELNEKLSSEKPEEKSPDSLENRLARLELFSEENKGQGEVISDLAERIETLETFTNSGSLLTQEQLTTALQGIKVQLATLTEKTEKEQPPAPAEVKE